MGKANRHVVKDREQSAMAEAFRTIRAGIIASQSEGELRTLLFASAGHGDGNAIVAANTAAMLAYSGKKVVLVDCDLRNPILQDVFSLKNIGVTNVLVQGKPLEEVIQSTSIINLSVVTSGPLPEKPFELLSNHNIKGMIEELKAKADFVIVNCSRLVVASEKMVLDACVLSSKVDGVLVVIDAREVRINTAKKALALLKGAKARIIGTVLNNVNSDEVFIYQVSGER